MRRPTKSTRSHSKVPPRRRPEPTASARPRAGRDRRTVHDEASIEALGESVRLQKVLARAGIASRRGSEALIEAGRVRVNGRSVTELGTRVNPRADRITVDGRPIALEQPVYIVLNKPDGVVSSGEAEEDARGRKTVISLLSGLKERVFPVGRLDYHTRGVLLLTNDGELSSRLLHPRFKVPKTYHVKFQGRLDLEHLEALESGVTLEDGTVTAPAVELVVIKETDANTWVQLTLTQGLYRQVRRMGDAIGRPVLKLLRVAVADITSDGLPDGMWRHLRNAEVADLRIRTGLTDAASPTRRSRG